MADGTDYTRDDCGAAVAGTAEERQSPAIAVRRAVHRSRHRRVISERWLSDPMVGEFGDLRLLRHVRDDLSGL